MEPLKDPKVKQLFEKIGEVRKAHQHMSMEGDEAPSPVTNDDEGYITAPSHDHEQVPEDSLTDMLAQQLAGLSVEGQMTPEQQRELSEVLASIEKMEIQYAPKFEKIIVKTCMHYE